MRCVRLMVCVCISVTLARELSLGCSRGLPVFVQLYSVSFWILCHRNADKWSQIDCALC